MTNGIGTYSKTAASNTALFPEGMNPSAVNDNMRQVQADIRTWYETAEWVDYGVTPTQTSTTTFTMAADQTSVFIKGRAIRCTDSSTLYGFITGSSFASSTTTITVALLSGSLSGSLTAVALGICAPTNMSLPYGFMQKGTSMASATTVDLSTANGSFVDISGTTTITGLGTVPAGVIFFLRFTGALILTHNAASLILPGAANITTAANDGAFMLSLGSGNWYCFMYRKANGQAIASTAVTFDSIAPTTTQGDTIYYNGSTNTRLAKGTAYQLYRMNSGATAPEWGTQGELQTVSSITGAVATGSTTTPNDDTIPQNTEGDQYLSLATTPKLSTSSLIIDVTANYSSTVSSQCIVGLYQDSNANALASIMQVMPAATGNLACTTFRYVMTSGTTSATTFKVRIGNTTAGTVTLNGSGGARKLGGSIVSSLTIMEVAA